MTFMQVDPPDGAPISDIAPVHPEPADGPPSDPIRPPSPAEAARENARNGRWAMNDYLDGWVLLGADGKPVMRNDRSRIGFFFHDVRRLAEEQAVESGREASPEQTLPTENENGAGDRAAAWRAHRRALAPLVSSLNDDWDPQIQKSYLATVTKMVRLLAYDYVRTTEPEEAVRRAVSDLLGNPIYVNGPRMRL